MNRSLWRFEHYILKPSAIACLVFGVVLLVARVWLEATVFIAAGSLVFSIAAIIHWDSMTRTFPKDWHKDDLSGMDPELAKFRFFNSVLGYSLLIGLVTAIVLIRFHQPWYYALLGGLCGILAAGVISAMVSIRPWPKK